VTFRVHITALLFALTLLLGQGVASAHIASYGDTPHDHDGVACTVALLAEDADIAVPPPPAPDITRAVSYTSDWQDAFAQRALPARTARGPPPRAPPH